VDPSLDRVRHTCGEWNITVEVGPIGDITFTGGPEGKFYMGFGGPDPDYVPLDVIESMLSRLAFCEEDQAEFLRRLAGG
jgi:hypothetical protein